MNKIFYFFFLLIFLFSGCENTVHEECDQSSINRTAYRYMKEWYLWYEYLPDINVDEFETLGEMLKAVRYSENNVLIDRFSSYSKKEDHENYYAGRRYGMGSSWKRDENNLLFVTIVYPESPADAGGLKRGQQILEINGFTVEELDENATYNKEHSDDKDFVKRTDWGNVYNAENKGEPVDIKVFEEGKEIDTRVYLGDYTMKSVLKHKVLDNNGVKTGYLHFKAFIEPSEDELNEVFAFFKEESIEELVLDLRYNGGGLVRISQQLINLIAGKTVKGEKIIKIIYNNKHSESNSHYEGKVLESSLDIKKVAIITTKGTASASEMVINSLQPFIEVSIIGDTTYGKPVGMNAKNICDQTIIPITFKNANAVDFGDYYHGIPATCKSEDDYKHDFGNEEEDSLKEALNYLKTGKCSSKSLSLRKLNPYIEDLIPFELEGMNKIDYTF